MSDQAEDPAQPEETGSRPRVNGDDSVEQPSVESFSPEPPLDPPRPVPEGLPVLDGDADGVPSMTEIRKPSTLGGLIYLAVLAAALIGVVVAASGAWRSGVSWIALALLAAAGARLALPDDDAGMLRVRRKSFDATILVTMGVALLALVASIPDQPS